MAEIVYSGWYTSIQDSGRFGHRDIGVPVSGVMDPVPMRFINGILGNPRGTAVLEITLRGPMLRFTSAGTICLGGPPMEADIDGNPLERYRSYA